ncbi:fibronectin-binding protein (FBP) [Segetibacter sp. 3557_3]|uniref:SIR2 family protein n=1 Tax=Segetibacter sp. 3557_3 TaxID=2547429 RepID=UPI00105840CF|nr:SIR2 family protein [Segetibacter sp. 3557_3]TDH26785.1 fibronectin-binding protein (FBP) [Segetibacter sp. 3557_3]
MDVEFWQRVHKVKTNTECESFNDAPQPSDWRPKIEPWLSAIFQSEHFSVLIGSGMTTGLCYMAGVEAQAMGRLELDGVYSQIIAEAANESASAMERGEANLEDDIRVALELLRGYQIQKHHDREQLNAELDHKLNSFIKNILATERSFKEKLGLATGEEQAKALVAFKYLNSFLLSFSSRAASRERLNIFTTNYDRFLEFGCDEAGIILMDRFKGKLQPIFRNTKLELDYHYNPPGIRGEPRYVEGVARITKLHGSVDWKFEDYGKIIRMLLPFGAADTHPEIPREATKQAVIYPNSAKDIETAYYPYSELFRDFSSSICRPNSAIVTYGYGFGDSHINRIIADMFTIPSTHLVIIAYGDPGDKIQRFLADKNEAQYTLLMGPHFGELKSLVDFYLPKSAIDRLTIKMRDLVSRRDKPGAVNSSSNNETTNSDEPAS